MTPPHKLRHTTCYSNRPVSGLKVSSNRKKDLLVSKKALISA